MDVRNHRLMWDMKRCKANKTTGADTEADDSVLDDYVSDESGTADSEADDKVEHIDVVSDSSLDYDTELEEIGKL